jgi:hypothetical protein
MAGAPKGNTNATKGKRWSLAIDKALENKCKSDGQKALVSIAEKLVEAAELGEQWAIKELGDRIDGRAAQSLTVGGDQENPLRTINEVLITPLLDESANDTDT